MTSPKQRFLADPVKVKAWNDVVGSTAFIEAMDAALLELVHRTQAGEVYLSQAALHRLVGAKQLSSILMNLGLKAEPPERAPNMNLETDDGLVPKHLKPTTTQL